MRRTALLIRCSVDEAIRVRNEAEIERRSVSGYVLNIVGRAVRVEDSLFEKMAQCGEFNRIPAPAR